MEFRIIVESFEIMPLGSFGPICEHPKKPNHFCCLWHPVIYSNDHIFLATERWAISLFLNEFTVLRNWTRDADQLELEPAHNFWASRLAVKLLPGSSLVQVFNRVVTLVLIWAPSKLLGSSWCRSHLIHYCVNLGPVLSSQSLNLKLSFYDSFESSIVSV